MLKIILDCIFGRCKIASSSNIKGYHSSGRKDQPGIWWLE